MRILLTTAHPHLPEIAGGAQSSIHQMALALQQCGHEVAVLSGLVGRGLAGIKPRMVLKLSGRRTVLDETLGYPTFRAWFPWECAKEVASRFKPDVVVPHSGFPMRMSRAFTCEDVPTAVYFRNVEPDDFGGEPAGSARTFIANSNFTASRLFRDYGVKAEVIPPLFDAGRYRTETSRRYVTYINPHPDKGRDLAFEVVRLCPDIEFLFVRAWTLEPDDEEALVSIERECDNLTVLDQTGDMRAIYAQTAVVLAPSRWDEAWGRIATEAHFSGIPVLASDRGGLPEAVGPGGILIDPDEGAGRWAEILKNLLADTTRYDRLSKAALAYSQRDAIDPSRQIEKFLSCLAVAIDVKAAPRPLATDSAPTLPPSPS